MRHLGDHKLKHKRFDFGFVFAEIFIFENRLPAVNDMGSFNDTGESILNMKISGNTRPKSKILVTPHKGPMTSKFLHPTQKIGSLDCPLNERCRLDRL